MGAVDARFVGTVTWRGGAMDRLLDERHAALVGAGATLLGSLGWHSTAEVTFNHFGDRRSIDLLASRGSTVLVLEAKTEIASIEETLRRLDIKVRLVPIIVEERVDLAPAVVGRLLLVRDSSANRARVRSNDAVLQGAFPQRGRSVMHWLREPGGPFAGLLFLRISDGVLRRDGEPAPHEPRPLGGDQIVPRHEDAGRIDDGPPSRTA